MIILLFIKEGQIWRVKYSVRCLKGRSIRTNQLLSWLIAGIGFLSCFSLCLSDWLTSYLSNQQKKIPILLLSCSDLCSHSRLHGKGFCIQGTCVKQRCSYSHVNLINFWTFFCGHRNWAGNKPTIFFKLFFFGEKNSKSSLVIMMSILGSIESCAMVIV